MTQATVAEYVVDRLSKLGITDCFGLPGDFAFPFDNAIAAHKSIQWLGCANELNAAYAADGYPRGHYKLWEDHVAQGDTGYDFDFMKGEGGIPEPDIE